MFKKLILFTIFLLLIFSGCKTKNTPLPVNEKDNILKEIPLYPGSEMTYKLNESDKLVNTIAMETKDPQEKIKNYYEKELSGKGWKTEEVFSSDKSLMFTGKKGELFINITVTKSSGEKNNIAIWGFRIK